MAHRVKPKRNKAYRPRQAAVPMMAETRNGLALELHLAVEALITAPSPDTYNQLSKMLATLSRAGTTALCLDLANTAMLIICARYERVGKVGLSDAEAETLRQAAGGLDQQIGIVPVNKFKQSAADVSAYCAEIGA